MCSKKSSGVVVIILDSSSRVSFRLDFPNVMSHSADVTVLGGKCSDIE